MSSNNSNSSRLTKNTILLYIRTIFTLLITLFTSRVILQTLGVENFGIYNLVGGFVSMFSVVSSTQTATTQRYLTYELGKKENGDVGKVYNISMSIHIYLVIILIVLLEVIGLPILNNVLKISSERLYAANWVFQFSVFSFLVSILASPLMALVVANERMKVFAYISMISAILKLAVAYAIYISPIDKLILYSFLLLLIALLERVIYGIYSTRRFTYIKFKLIREWSQFKEIFKFAGMNFIGSFASILCNQGISVILNIFYGVTVNAARAIAIQVQSAVERFTGDFMTALNPQITKEYASGNIDKALTLASVGSKFSFYLMLLMASVFIVRADYLLELWLGAIPEYTVDFVRITICISLANLLSNPVVTIILADGNLASFTFWIGGIRIIMIPTVYFALCFGVSPQTVYLIVLSFEVVALLCRLIIVNKMVGHQFLLSFLKSVMTRAVFVLVVVLVLISKLNSIFPDNFAGFAIAGTVNVVLTAIVILMIGINSSERQYLLNFVKLKANRKYSNSK